MISGVAPCVYVCVFVIQHDHSFKKVSVDTGQVDFEVARGLINERVWVIDGDGGGSGGGGGGGSSLGFGLMGIANVVRLVGDVV